MNVSTVDQSPLRKRAARFGWLTFGLATLAIGLLVVAAVRLIQDGPTIQAAARSCSPPHFWSHRPSSGWPGCRPRR